MDHKQTIAMLTWINQVDPRVMLNQAAAETWAYSLRSVDPAVAKQAVLEHYKANESIAASPGAISKRAANIKNSRDAGQRAIEPMGHQQNASDGQLFQSWRQRNPERWAELMEQGAAERRADLEARGLPSRFPGRAA